MQNIPNVLDEAFCFAERLRFSGDKPTKFHAIEDSSFDKIHGRISQDGLLISKSLTPGIISTLEEATDKLKLPHGTTTAYVYSSSELQAECYSGVEDECIIRISSSLIKLLSDKELSFVIGHEIGHFLLRHGVRSKFGDPYSKEFFMQQRCQEISVDRLGLVACGCLDSSVRALMKIISGLDESYLRFDIGSFLAQLGNGSDDKVFAPDNSTHPSLVMRCKALLWFSMSDAYSKIKGQNEGLNLDRTNKLIERDFKQYVDGHVREEIVDALENLRLWLAVSASIRDGLLDRKEQALISDLFGKATLGKLLGLYSNCKFDEIKSLTRDRLGKAFGTYKKLAPTQCTDEFPSILRELGEIFDQDDFQQYIRDQFHL